MDESVVHASTTHRSSSTLRGKAEQMEAGAAEWTVGPAIANSYCKNYCSNYCKSGCKNYFSNCCNNYCKNA